MSYRERLDNWLLQEKLRQTVLSAIAPGGACWRGETVWLVGGTVRDALMGLDGDDMDVAVLGDALSLARRVADHIRAAYVPLDHEHNVARVVSHARGRELHFDLAGLRGDDIETDLRLRDFTVNAMAVPVMSSAQGFLDELLDPTGGQHDIQRRLIRITQRQAFADDPLRVLRAVRQAGALCFTLDPDTARLARHWAPALSNVSGERIRDELLRMLELPDASSVLRLAGDLGAIDVALPSIAADGKLERSLQSLAALESAAWRTDRSGLGRFASAYAAHQNQMLAAGHRRAIMTRLAALLAPATHDGAWSIPQDEGARLRLSRREIDHVASVCGATHDALWSSEGLDAVAIYRYYRRWKAGGVDAAVLRASWALGGLVSGSQGNTLRAEELLSAWFEQHKQIVAPPALVDGRQLMQALGLRSGPHVGVLLDAVREAQVRGEVRSAEEAIAHARHAHGAAD